LLGAAQGALIRAGASSQTFGGSPQDIMLEPDEPKWKTILRVIGWRRNLAIVVWLLCVLGSFLPTSSSVFVYPIVLRTRIYPPTSTPLILVGISIPLAMILVGSWLSDDDESVLKQVFGYVLEFFGWLEFVYLIGLFLLGPLILMVS
jgi:hypothetical protein